MGAPLKHVQWIAISDVAELWQPFLKMPIGIIQHELRLGWFKWTRFKEGVDGFVCGKPLDKHPPEKDLPPKDTKIDREFLEEFAIKQGWQLPKEWFDDNRKGISDRSVGRPSNKRAIAQELKRRSEQGELEEKLADQSRSLLDWAEKKFPDEQIPTLKTMENNIRQDFRAFKIMEKKKAPEN